MKWLLFPMIGLAVISIGVFLALEYPAPLQIVGLATRLEFTEKTIHVAKGGSFQAALDAAKPGDTISLASGETFYGSFKLPKKPGSEFITIRTSAPDSKLPPAGTRIVPAQHSGFLAKLESNLKGEPVILAVDGAHHYRFIGIEFKPTIEGLFDIIRIGKGGSEESIDELPHHIEFDRVWIYGSRKHGQRRGISANGKHLKIVNSHISEIKRKGDESQAIAAWATDGPIEIVNNYLEGAAENILFGGANSRLRLVPADCVVDSNHLNKPLEWREDEWVVKNLFEIKNGRRIKITNNLMTNNWAMGQDGVAVLFTVQEEGNGKAATIEDIEFSGNIVRGSAGGLNVLGGNGSGGHRLVVRNNLWEDLDGPKWGGAGHFMKATDWRGFAIENNTILQTGNITNSYGPPITNFVFRNNIVFENEYGIKGDDSGSGQIAIDIFYPGGFVSNNIIIGGTQRLYKEANIFINSLDEIRFLDPKNNDYRLSPASPYFKAGHRGTRIGSNLDPKKVGRK